MFPKDSIMNIEVECFVIIRRRPAVRAGTAVLEQLGNPHASIVADWARTWQLQTSGGWKRGTLERVGYGEIGRHPSGQGAGV